MTIYEELKANDINMDSHESDLYAIVNDVSSGIISRYPYKCNVTRFISQIDKKLWFDIPFANDNFRK